MLPHVSEVEDVQGSLGSTMAWRSCTSVLLRLTGGDISWSSMRRGGSVTTAGGRVVLPPDSRDRVLARLALAAGLIDSLVLSTGSKYRCCSDLMLSSVVFCVQTVRAGLD